VFDGSRPPAPPEPGKPLPRVCGMAMLTMRGYEVPGATMQEFCRALRSLADRDVIDRTGLAGTFDIHLDLTGADFGHPDPGQRDSAEPAAPDSAEVFANVRRAIGGIGLRLVPTTGPSDYLVIDHVERPSEN
jgi:uncharacterized protein (TIGR03435 family)